MMPNWQYHFSSRLASPTQTDPNTTKPNKDWYHILNFFLFWFHWSLDYDMCFHDIKKIRFWSSVSPFCNNIGMNRFIHSIWFDLIRFLSRFESIRFDSIGFLMASVHFVFFCSSFFLEINCWIFSSSSSANFCWTKELMIEQTK
jgi:hypothetical protein